MIYLLKENYIIDGNVKTDYTLITVVVENLFTMYFLLINYVHSIMIRVCFLIQYQKFILMY